MPCRPTARHGDVDTRKGIAAFAYLATGERAPPQLRTPSRGVTRMRVERNNVTPFPLCSRWVHVCSTEGLSYIAERFSKNCHAVVGR